METKKSASLHSYLRPLILFLVLSMTITLLLCACSPSQEDSDPENTNQENVNQNSEILIGFISIQDGKVTLDEVEIITEEDTDRIEELGLTYQGDLINGYYIYNEEESTCTLSLTDKTKYIFTDSGQLYLTLEEDKDLVYETTSLEEFVKGSCYASSVIADAQSDIPSGRIPYFVEVLGDEVISITEEFCYTM